MKLTKQVLKELNRKVHKKSFVDIEFFFGEGQKKYEKNDEFQKIINELEKRKYIEIDGGKYRSRIIKGDWSTSKGNYENIHARITLDGQGFLKNQSFNWFKFVPLALLIVGILNLIKGSSTTQQKIDNEKIISSIHTDTIKKIEQDDIKYKTDIKTKNPKVPKKKAKETTPKKTLALGIYIDRKIPLNKYKFDYNGLLTQNGIEHGYISTDSLTLKNLKIIKPNQKIILYSLTLPTINKFELYDSLIINQVSKTLQGNGNLILTSISKIEPDFYLIEPEKELQKGNYSLYDTAEEIGYLFRVE